MCVVVCGLWWVQHMLRVCDRMMTQCMLPGSQWALETGSGHVRRQHYDHLRWVQPALRGLLRRRLVLRPTGQHLDGNISVGSLRWRYLSVCVHVLNFGIGSDIYPSGLFRWSYLSRVWLGVMKCNRWSISRTISVGAPRWRYLSMIGYDRGDEKRPLVRFARGTISLEFGLSWWRSIRHFFGLCLLVILPRVESWIQLSQTQK